MRRIGLVLLLLIADCTDNGSRQTSIPVDAEAIQAYTTLGVTLMVQRLGGLESFLPFLVSPDSPESGDLVFEPDTSPGAAPFSYTFTIPVDANWNGSDETTVAGGATFDRDPASAERQLGGHLDITMEAVGGLANFDGGVDFTLAPSGREISGSGTFTELGTGNSTVITVDPGAPLDAIRAEGSGNSVANACGYSLDGSVHLLVSGPQGSVSSSWGFAHDRPAVAVTGATYTDPYGDATPLPDREVVLQCGQNRSIADWEGVFVQNWACLPQEFGEANLTITVVDADTIRISDEDPPMSGDVNVYEATAVPGNPHVVKGFFVGGPVGNTYREDFTWTMSRNHRGFMQSSQYVYQEGPGAGGGGMCGAMARRGA